MPPESLLSPALRLHPCFTVIASDGGLGSHLLWALPMASPPAESKQQRVLAKWISPHPFIVQTLQLPDQDDLQVHSESTQNFTSCSLAGLWTALGLPFVRATLAFHLLPSTNPLPTSKPLLMFGLPSVPSFHFISTG